jgi:hypothetical protein
MKVLISSLEDQKHEGEVEVSELNYEREKGCFWMRCVMGDDWFQRVNSSLPSKPRLVRIVDRIIFVVFNLQSEAEQFSVWLAEAQAVVEYGYTTMRG